MSGPRRLAIGLIALACALAAGVGVVAAAGDGSGGCVPPSDIMILRPDPGEVVPSPVRFDVLTSGSIAGGRSTCSGPGVASLLVDDDEHPLNGGRSADVRLRAGRHTALAYLLQRLNPLTGVPEVTASVSFVVAKTTRSARPKKPSRRVKDLRKRLARVREFIERQTGPLAAPNWTVLALQDVDRRLAAIQDRALRLEAADTPGDRASLARLRRAAVAVATGTFEPRVLRASRNGPPVRPPAQRVRIPIRPIIR